MNREEYAKKIEDLFTSFFEKTLSDMLGGNPQFKDFTNCAFITLQDDLLQAFVKSYNLYFNKAEMSELQSAEYDKALIYQMLYVLTEGDFRLISGYDLVTNSMINKSELEKRYISPMAKMTLTNAGLLYRAGSRETFIFWRRGF